MTKRVSDCRMIWRDNNCGAHPTLRLLARLNRRNEYLISSHHPLRETLMQQTGLTIEQRASFLSKFHARAWASLIHLWEPDEKEDVSF